VAIWPEKFLVGPYTATLTLSLSDSGPLFTKQIVFFAFPLEYLAAILLIIGLIIFIAVRVNNSRKDL
jgi:type II secretory pathway component PulF